MQRVFQPFADRIAESREPEVFRVAVADTAAVIELPCFAYLRLPRDGRSLAALISTYPTPWTDHYLREHYERFDPVILSAHFGHPSRGANCNTSMAIMPPGRPRAAFMALD